MSGNKLYQAKCRELMSEHGAMLEVFQKEIESELEREKINESTAFATAKKTIRKEGIKEGVNMLLRKIAQYAAER